MPTAVVFQATASSSVPTPTGVGRSLFSDVNNGGALTVKLPNGTTQVLDATFTALGCGCGPCGGGGGACDCLAVANCIDTDPNVQNSLTNFNNTWFNGVADLGGLSDVDLTGLNDNDIIQYDLATNTWLPVPLPGGGADVLVKVTAADTTAGYLDDKVVVGSTNLVKTILNPAADEDLELDLNTTLTNMVNIDVDTLTVTTQANFTGTDVNFTNADIDYINSTIDMDATTVLTVNTANITNLDVTNITYGGQTGPAILKRTTTWTPTGTSFAFADADSVADSVVLGWTITSGTQVGFWTFDVSTPGTITINSTATETASIGITYILAV